MSGIAGIIDKNGNQPKPEQVKKLLEKISHRGDREETLVAQDRSCMGMISHFPAPSNSRTLIDGKIYNIDSMAEKYGINTEEDISDSEKVSQLISKKGPSVLKEFQGAFSLAATDENNNLFLARDTIGIKPLYYARDDKGMAFASEIKSLVEYGENINEFPPGHIMKNSSSPQEYDSIQVQDYEFLSKTDPEEIIDRLDNMLLKSIQKRIEGYDGEIGVWLSGGVDSSLVAAMVMKFTDKLYTFSVGFEGSPDLEASKVVARALGTRHLEHKLSLDELFNTIPEVIYHLESFDAPLVRSSLGNMIVSRISSSRTDLVFSGEGGDEVFGGYNYFLDYSSSDKIQKELVKAINSLHNTALQRVDRLANAYNMKVRLPLLDENLIDFALTIPTDHKVKPDENISKYVLRKVAERYLPPEIAWRGKEKFWEGSGIQDTLTERIEDNIDDSYFEKNRHLDNGFTLRNKEEMYFYKLFRKYFGAVDIENILSFTQDFN